MKRVNLIWGLVALSGVAMFGAGSAAIYSDPHIFSEKALTYAAGHPVSLGEIHFTSLNPLHIEADDIHVKNAPWDSQSDMLTIGHVSADLKLTPLLVGKIKFIHMKMDDANLLLERDGNGVGNWRKEGDTKPHIVAPVTQARRSRTHFPVILNLALHNGNIRFHTSGGATLKIDLKNLVLQADGEDQPINLKVDGAYNDLPVNLDVHAQSFKALHDSRKPFNAKILVEGATTSIVMNADMMDPINFDQFTAQMQVNVRNIGRMAAIFDAPFHWDVPLEVNSIFKRQGDVWSLSQATGQIAGNQFDDSQLKLTEGARKQSDSVQTALNFENLNLDALIPEAKSPRPSPSNLELSFLRVGDKPSILLDASASAEKLSYKNLRAQNLKLHGTQKPGSMALDNMSANIFGAGILQANLAAEDIKEGSNVSIKLNLAHADIKEILQALHTDNTIATGSVNADMQIKSAGQTLQQLKETTNGHAVLSVTDGQISRRMMQLAATDVHALFDQDRLVPISCLKAEVNFKNGIGNLTSFVAKSAAGDFAGNGIINLPQDTLDFKLKANPKTTSFLALDMPIQVKGKLDDPHTGLAADTHQMIDATPASLSNCF